MGNDPTGTWLLRPEYSVTLGGMIPDACWDVMRMIANTPDRGGEGGLGWKGGRRRMLGHQG